MNEILNYYLQAVFFSYGLYSIVYLILRIAKVKPVLIDSIDKAATLVISLSGILYLVLLLILFIWYQEDFLKRFGGAYWFAPASIFMVMGVMSQLLWMEKLRLSYIVRILIILLFILVTQAENITIIATSFHHGYSMGITTILRGYFMQLFLFCISVLVLLEGKKLIGKLRK